MKKYIDADLLKAEFTGNFCCEYPAPLVKALIDRQPAANVEEVKHGKWENMTDVDSAYLNTYRCSACGTTFWIDENPEDANYNHCPNCGAKMDTEQEKNT